MAFQAYATAVPGSMLTAAFWNQNVRDNGIDIRGGGIQLAGQQANDFLYASAPDQLARVPFADNTMLMQAGNPPFGLRALGAQPLWIPARAWTPTPDYANRPLPFVDISTDWWRPIYTKPQRKDCFDITLTTLAMPNQWDKGNLTGRIYWTMNTADTGSVDWVIYVVEDFADGENLDGWGNWGMGEVYDTANGLRRLCITNPFTITVGNPGDRKLLRLNLFRNVTGGNDSNPATVYFIGLALSYNTSALSDIGNT